MPVNHGRIEVSYNVQTAVDSKHCLIVNYENTNTNDKKALVSVAVETKNILQKNSIEVLADKGYHNGEQIDVCTKNDIVTYVAVPDIPRSNETPTPSYFGDKFRYDSLKDTFTCPEGFILQTNGKWYQKGNGKKYHNLVKHYKTAACGTCSAKSLCTTNARGRLIERSQYAKSVEENAKRINEEKEKYLLRQQIVEHPFGTIKRQWGFDYVLLKGLKKNEADFGLIFSAYNLRRILSILGIPELKKRLKGVFIFFHNPIRYIKHYTIKYFFYQYSV